MAAALSFYLTATTSGSWRTIDEATQAAATNNDGWVVSTGSTNSSEYFVGVERAASTFTADTVPDGTLDTTNKDAFRSTNAYTGNFASANWVLTFNVCAVTSATGQDGWIVFRLIKAAADGSSASEITVAQQTCSTITDVAASPGSESTLTVNPGAFSLANQYLFVQLAWRRSGAASMTTADVNWRTGQSTILGTRIVTAAFTRTAALTSVTGTGTVGSLGKAIAKALTGNTGTGSVGVFTPKTSYSIAITGNSATGSVGTFGKAINKTLSGVTGTGSVGALGKKVATTLTGNTATGSVGTVALRIAKALTGNTGTGTAGSLGKRVSLTLTGNIATGSLGNLGKAISKAITGNIALGDVGILTPVTGGGGGSTIVFFAGVSTADGVTHYKGLSRPTIELADAGGGTYTVTETHELSGNFKPDSVSQETYLIDGELP